MKQFTVWKELRSASSKACQLLNNLNPNVSKIPVRFKSNLPLKYKYNFKCTFWMYVTVSQYTVQRNTKSSNICFCSWKLCLCCWKI